MSRAHTSGLIPLNDCVLVELKQSYKNFTAKEAKHETRTEGIVVGLAPYKDPPLINVTMDLKVVDLLGKRVHFEEFKEGARIKRDGKLYSFIRLEDIRGYEDNVEAS